jgi:hypothetical protein
MFVSCTVFVLSGRGRIPRPEESCPMWCVIKCDQVTIKPSTHDVNKWVEEGRTTKHKTSLLKCTFLCCWLFLLTAVKEFCTEICWRWKRKVCGLLVI